MPKVVFLTNLAPDTAALLTSQAPAEFAVTTASAKLPPNEQVDLTHDADFVILFPGVISGEALHAAKNLKLIQLVSAGFDTLDINLCKELEIPVSNNGGTNSTDVAEHTLTLILAWYRQLGAMDRNVRSERWGAIDSGVSTYTINGKPLDEFFPRPTLQRNIRQPLEAVGFEERMDVIARMEGGGVSAQAGALRHGISRALIDADPNLRSELKRRGFLTRDARVKERKKAGFKKARKRPQFSKR